MYNSLTIRRAELSAGLKAWGTRLIDIASDLELFNSSPVYMGI